jgi:hypothetical protein
MLTKGGRGGDKKKGMHQTPVFTLSSDIDTHDATVRLIRTRNIYLRYFKNQYNKVSVESRIGTNVRSIV